MQFNCKGLILFLSIAMCVAPAFAQTEGFKAGVKLGANTSQIDGDGYMGFYKFSPVTGVFASHGIGEKYRFQYEIVYQNKGSRKVPDPDNGVYDSYKIHLQTVGVPFLVQRKWKEFVFELGLGFNVQFASREENESGTVTNSSFSWSKYEFDGMAGAGYGFNAHWFIHARSHRSITSILTNTAYTRYGIYGAAYHTVIALTLDYRF